MVDGSMLVALMKIRMEKGYFFSFLFAQNDISLSCFQIAIVSGGTSMHKEGKDIELLTTEILNIDRGSGWTRVGSLPVAARTGPRIGNLGNTLYLTGMEDNAGELTGHHLNFSKYYFTMNTVSLQDLLGNLQLQHKSGMGTA